MEDRELRRLRECGVPMDGSGPMHAMYMGRRPANGEPPPVIDRSEWENEIKASEAEEVEWWQGRTVSARLVVELPFWLMLPNCEIFVHHDIASVMASVRGDYMEVSNGNLYLDSHHNVVHIGPNDELKVGRESPASVRQLETPVFRPMKTVVIFRVVVMEDAVLAVPDNPASWEDNRGLRRLSRATQYLESLASAYIPLLNSLITSYRLSCLDPFAFQVSEWDVPIWFVDLDGALARICLMPYWESVWYPTLSRTSDGARIKFFAARPSEVESHLKSDDSPGSLELLDALSLQYRGRYDDAVRSAVTAIEVALEAQLQKLLRARGYDDEAIQRHLNASRNSFERRLLDYEKLSGTRVPGPIVSCVPYINGIRLKNELSSVRQLRHEIVHEGIRVDIHSRGLMLRAIETMTWLFRWLSWDEGSAKESSRNYTYYSLLRGNLKYPFEYRKSGVEVLPLSHDKATVKNAEEIYVAQYLGAIGSGGGDLELFARMSLEWLNIEVIDGPPSLSNDPLLRERFRITHKQHQAVVFCLEFDGLIEAQALGPVALSALAYGRRTGPCTTLCIVHHQRHIPIGLREFENAIPSEVRAVAEECGITLVTAPDLGALVLGTHTYLWNIDEVCAILFRAGRQGEVPPVYRRIGTYGRFFPRHSAMSIDLDDGVTVALGDTVGVRTHGFYHEETIESLQVEHNAVTAATGSCKVGIKTTLCRRNLVVGQSVFVRVAHVVAESDD